MLLGVVALYLGNGRPQPEQPALPALPPLVHARPAFAVRPSAPSATIRGFLILGRLPTVAVGMFSGTPPLAGQWLLLSILCKLGG